MAKMNAEHLGTPKEHFKNVGRSLAWLRKNSKFTDLHFICQTKDKKCFKPVLCHKAIFGPHSTILRDLFKIVDEKDPSGTVIINLDGIDFGTMEKVAEYIYLGQTTVRNPQKLLMWEAIKVLGLDIEIENDKFQSSGSDSEESVETKPQKRLFRNPVAIKQDYDEHLRKEAETKKSCVEVTLLEDCKDREVEKYMSKLKSSERTSQAKRRLEESPKKPRILKDSKNDEDDKVASSDDSFSDDKHEGKASEIAKRPRMVKNPVAKKDNHENKKTANPTKPGITKDSAAKKGNHVNKERGEAKKPRITKPVADDGDDEDCVSDNARKPRLENNDLGVNGNKNDVAAKQRTKSKSSNKEVANKELKVTQTLQSSEELEKKSNSKVATVGRNLKIGPASKTKGGTASVNNTVTSEPKPKNEDLEVQPCGVCNVFFITLDALKSHMERVHGGDSSDEEEDLPRVTTPPRTVPASASRRKPGPKSKKKPETIRLERKSRESKISATSSSSDDEDVAPKPASASKKPETIKIERKNRDTKIDLTSSSDSDDKKVKPGKMSGSSYKTKNKPGPMSKRRRSSMSDTKGPSKILKLTSSDESKNENPKKEKSSKIRISLTPKSTLKSSPKPRPLCLQRNSRGSGGDSTWRQCCLCDEKSDKLANMKNHTLNHFKKDLMPMLTSGLRCPKCDQVSRDKITLLRHYAFSHKMIFEFCPEEKLKGKPIPLGDYEGPTTSSSNSKSPNKPGPKTTKSKMTISSSSESESGEPQEKQKNAKEDDDKVLDGQEPKKSPQPTPMTFSSDSEDDLMKTAAKATKSFDELFGKDLKDNE